MNKQMIMHECKKALTSPILLILFVVFFVFNSFVIFSNTYLKDEMKMANRLADTYGLDITAESIRQFERDMQADYKELSILTGESHASVYPYLEKLSWDEFHQLSEANQTFLHQLELKERYLTYAKEIDDSYEMLDMNKIAEHTIEKYRLSGKTASLLRTEYEKLAERVEEIKENGEHKTWFFLGKNYEMHTFLFRNIIFKVMMEALLLTVLATALLANYEFEQRTQLLVYSTQRGRQVMKDKRIASLIVSTLFAVCLFLLTLGVYFFVFDYDHLWKSSISSAFNWEYQLPYFTWWDMPFWKFLTLVMMLTIVTILLFSLLTFSVSVFVKNSYFTFFIIGGFFILLLLLPGFMPTDSIWLYITSYNIAALVMNPHMLFTGSSYLMMFKNHEWLTLVVWTAMFISIGWLTLRYFSKQDIQ